MKYIIAAVAVSLLGYILVDGFVTSARSRDAVAKWDMCHSELVASSSLDKERRQALRAVLDQEIIAYEKSAESNSLHAFLAIVCAVLLVTLLMLSGSRSQENAA